MPIKTRLLDILFNPIKYWNIISRPYRRRILSLQNVHYGSNVSVIGKPHITNQGGGIYLGDNVRLISSQNNFEIGLPSPVVLTTRGKGVIEIKGNSVVNGASIRAFDRVTIGQNVWITSNCYILDSDGHPIEGEKRLDERQNDSEASPIYIDDNVWLGINSIILPGVKIGKNVVIGAGSVVTKSIPPNSLAVGVPAKVIRNI